MPEKSINTSILEQRTEELRNSEDRYHRMIEEIEDYAIILLDPNGIIQNWNKGAEHIKQYKESEAVGRSFEMFYLPEDRATKLPQRLIQEAVIKGKALHEGWRMRKDQSKFWGSITLTALHDNNGEVIGFSKVTRDLTEKKLAEDQLKNYAIELQIRNEELVKSEERYHNMIAEIQDYAIILLNKSGDIQNWNIGAEKIKGYKAEEIIGKNFRQFYLQEDRDRKLPEQLIGEAIASGKANHEGWRVRKDGTTFWGSVVITALHNQEGKVIAFSKVTRDLTERKKAEDKMKEYLLELETRNKELEEFAYIASHDLQEPLRKIQTFTEIIERNLHNETIAKKYFPKINAAALRMVALIQSILNYSRLSSSETDQLEEINLNEVLESVLNDLELVIDEKHGKIVKDVLPTIPANRYQMNQLFYNLIINSLKYSNKAPLIEISSSIISKDEIDSPTKLLIADQYLQIIIRDNGIGFDQKYEKIMFSMFQRLHPKDEYSGTGIGLALCKKIMDNHHGFITAKGEPDKGATFYLQFPLE